MTRSRLVNTVWTLVAAAGLAGLLEQPARAADVIDLSMGYYRDDDRLTVNTPSLSVTKDIGQATLNIKYTYETFEKEAPASTLDAVTGATTVSGGTGGGYEEVRHEVVGGGSRRIGSTVLGGGFFYGNEDDFLSYAYSLAVSQELFQKNLILTVLYGKTADEIAKLSPPNAGFPKHKDNTTYTIAATQILTPALLVAGGYSTSDVEGYQSLPLRKIQVPQTVPGVFTIYEEVHPDLRTRQTFFLRLKKYFVSRFSSDLNLSYYLDDWGVQAIAAEPRVEQYLTDSVTIRVRYRYYSQAAADFYKPLYTVQELLMTADARLREFDTHTVGVALRLLGDTTTDWSVSMGYDRYFETNDGIKANMFQVSLRIPY